MSTETLEATNGRSEDEAAQRLPVEAPRESMAARIVAAVTKGPIYVVMIGVGVFWLVPTIGLFIASLRTPAQNATSGWWTALTEPSQLTLENYREMFSEGSQIPDALWNTVLISLPTTLIVLLAGSMAAFAFAWVRFPGRDALFILVVSLLVVPVQVALIPIAQLYGDIGLFGKIPGVVLFHVAFGLPLAIFLLRNFFVGIPGELLEAARMDGASEMRIFFRVVLPLGVPALAALAIFQFLWVWNDLLIALVFASRESAPITVAIRDQTRQFGSNIDIIAPGAFISMVIPLIVFFSFQRYFVQGLLAGSQK